VSNCNLPTQSGWFIRKSKAVMTCLQSRLRKGASQTACSGQIKIWHESHHSHLLLRPLLSGYCRNANNPCNDMVPHWPSSRGRWTLHQQLQNLRSDSDEWLGFIAYSVREYAYDSEIIHNLNIRPSSRVLWTRNAQKMETHSHRRVRRTRHKIISETFLQMKNFRFIS